MTKESLENQLHGARTEIRRLRDENDELRKRVERCSIDPVTNLFGNAALDVHIRQEFSRRNHDPNYHISIVVIDLNELKLVNDRHGHQAGNRMLHDFGQYLRKLVRDYDVVGRWGGDEFVVILPNNQLGDAQKTAKRFEVAFASLTIEYFSGAAVGVASTSDHPDATADELFEIADTEMYRNKQKMKEGLSKVHE